MRKFVRNNADYIAGSLLGVFWIIVILYSTGTLW